MKKPLPHASRAYCAPIKIAAKDAKKEIEMTKEQILEIIKLLSALESWSFSAGQRMPDYLFERLDKSINELTEEVLK